MARNEDADQTKRALLIGGIALAALLLCFALLTWLVLDGRTQAFDDGVLDTLVSHGGADGFFVDPFGTADDAPGDAIN